MEIAKNVVQGLLFFLHEQSEIPGLGKAFVAANPKVSVKHLRQRIQKSPST